MKLHTFFARYPVFARREYIEFLKSKGVVNPNTQRELLAYHLKQGRIVRIRQGLFASVPQSLSESLDMPIDVYLIAGRVVDDAVLSYHTALDFFGNSYSVYYEFYYLSSHAIKPFQYQGNSFRRIKIPKALISKKKEMFSVTKQDRQGLDIRVTSLERTVVDVLDRSDLGGGYEEIWRSIEMVSVLDVDLMIQYVLLLENATTSAKVGLFLEMHQQEFSVSKKHLSKLEGLVPKTKHYIDRTSAGKSKYVKRWNLLVPVEILEKNWEEPDDSI